VLVLVPEQGHGRRPLVFLVQFVRGLLDRSVGLLVVSKAVDNMLRSAIRKWIAIVLSH
jgi:hypothetical protein